MKISAVIQYISVFTLSLLATLATGTEVSSRNNDYYQTDPGLWQCDAESKTGFGFGESSNKSEAVEQALSLCHRDSTKSHTCEILDCNWEPDIT